MIVGVSIPYLLVVLGMRDFIADRITSLFLIVYGTHQVKAGPSAMPRALANSATSIGWDSFIYFKWENILLTTLSDDVHVVLSYVRRRVFLVVNYPFHHGKGESTRIFLS